MPRAFLGKELRAAIRKQVRIGWQTKGNYYNEAMPYVLEYTMRKQLAALGFEQRFDDLDCLTAEALILIDAEYAGVMADEQKKAMRSHKGGR